ncbi:MAG: hypothetical protein JWL91_360 [Sphingomonas bacterium]|nr:hypothetical protein [Sphingomonas bacterium]MDB5688484.1 hypothetical protein [Sphingomonas bacterium]
MGDERDSAGDARGYDAEPDPEPGAPSTSPASPPADAGEAWSFRNAGERRNHDEDPDYASWRGAQMEAFDRDYEEYRRQHPSGLESGFAEWRQAREKEGR